MSNGQDLNNFRQNPKIIKKNKKGMGKVVGNGGIGEGPEGTSAHLYTQLEDQSGDN